MEIGSSHPREEREGSSSPHRRATTSLSGAAAQREILPPLRLKASSAPPGSAAGPRNGPEMVQHVEPTEASDAPCGSRTRLRYWLQACSVSGVSPDPEDALPDALYESRSRLKTARKRGCRHRSPHDPPSIPPISVDCRPSHPRERLQACHRPWRGRPEPINARTPDTLPDAASTGHASTSARRPAGPSCRASRRDLGPGASGLPAHETSPALVRRGAGPCEEPPRGPSRTDERRTARIDWQTDRGSSRMMVQPRDLATRSPQGVPDRRKPGKFATTTPVTMDHWKRRRPRPSCSVCVIVLLDSSPVHESMKSLGEFSATSPVSAKSSHAWTSG